MIPRQSLQSGSLQKSIEHPGALTTYPFHRSGVARCAAICRREHFIRLQCNPRAVFSLCLSKTGLAMKELYLPFPSGVSALNVFCGEPGLTQAELGHVLFAYGV